MGQETYAVNGSYRYALHFEGMYVCTNINNYY